VAYNRRQPPRRQGIRYGPPREQARFSDNGVLIGRFLGLGILLLTIGVLAAGALAFMRDSPRATSTPERSAFVAFSPTPAATVTLLPTSTPLATALPTPAESAVPASLEPTPAPTNPAPLVQIGEGFVTFGTQADDSLRVVDPRSVFRPNERIVWSAFLSERADSIDLLVRITKLDSTAIGGERIISDSPVTPLVRGAQIFQNRIRTARDLEGPGVYAVRYFRGEEILSEGFLEITE
jgi:hypothetical protein